jgi:hypothetical protein
MTTLVLTTLSNISYAHLSSNIIQTLIDRQNNLKIQFSYLPEQPTMDDLIQLQFSIQNLQTGNHLKNLIAKPTLINTRAAHISIREEISMRFRYIAHISIQYGTSSLFAISAGLGGGILIN